ncbi:hypothetical protein GMA3_104 [Gordonia phage GMA3]|uniref:Uncharacterized protein n=1 Tax=Gordonia phage GMA3 TaxID=1647284 RepID=A0A0K0NKP0_9CAUD|nr:hypothetical protein AU105_gp104 [Gordonia phage GMA3]AKL88281.1 hypothetical protein GMA3_104 [Gordonia phage GMA3]
MECLQNVCGYFQFPLAGTGGHSPFGHLSMAHARGAAKFVI